MAHVTIRKIEKAYQQELSKTDRELIKANKETAVWKANYEEVLDELFEKERQNAILKRALELKENKQKEMLIM